MSNIQQNGAFLLPGCCDPFNEKALRASRGASFQLRIVSGTWNHLESLKNEFQIKMLAGHPGTDEKLKPVSHLSQKLADSFADVPLSLVLGSEGSGLSEKSRRLCELVSIPMAGEFESLNVSVAGGIFLYVLQPKNHKSLMWFFTIWDGQYLCKSPTQNCVVSFSEGVMYIQRLGGF